MNRQRWSSAPSIHAALSITTICLGGSLFWAVTAQLEGAVVAGGVVEVGQGGQSVQHPDGGVIQHIVVSNSDIVEKGQVVAILDGRDLREQHRALERQLFETWLNMDRILSQTDGRAQLHLRSALLDRGASDADLARRLEDERRHFAAWRGVQNGREAQLAGRIQSQNATLEGLLRQREALSEARALTLQRAEDRRALLARGLERATAVAQIERDRMDLDAALAALDARISEARGALEELSGEMDRILEAEAQEAHGEYRDHAEREGELLSQLRLLERRIDLQDIRAPVAGAVHDLQVFTEGGVVGPGQILMTIIPDDQPLLFSVRVSPNDIEHVQPGQATKVQFPGLSLRNLQPMSARVQTVSPDVVVDPNSGLTHYRVVLAPVAAWQETLGAINLVPGMPVQANIQTGARSVMRYLLAPLEDFFRSSMSET